MYYNKVSFQGLLHYFDNDDISEKRHGISTEDYKNRIVTSALGYVFICKINSPISRVYISLIKEISLALYWLAVY